MSPDDRETLDAFAEDVEVLVETLRTAAHDLENLASRLRRVAHPRVDEARQ